MLKIRLFRTGKKHKPNYRLVVAEHTSAIGGKFIEIVGNYNPFTDKVVIDKEKITKWLNNGAKPTNRVAIILTKEGMKHKSITIHKFAERPSKKETPAEQAKPAEEAPATEPTPAKEEGAAEVKPAEEVKPTEEIKEEPKPETPAENK